MTAGIGRQYLENEIQGADCRELIIILYEAAIEAIGRARMCLRTGDIRERSRQVAKAAAMVEELLRSLEHREGGGISKNLAGLYAYAHQRLVEANTTQTEPPLEEVSRLLGTLLDAWKAVAEMPPPTGRPFISLNA